MKNQSRETALNDVSPNSASPRSLLVWVFAIAMAFRLTVNLVMLQELDSDPDSYRRIAKGLDSTGIFGIVDPQGNGIPTAYRPPLYPWILSFFQKFPSDQYPIAIFHALLGALTVSLTWDIAHRMGWNRRSLLAALLVLLDPILLRQSTLVMTETLATFMGVGIWWSHFLFLSSDRPDQRKRWMQGAFMGLALGLACLCRPTALAWCALLGALELKRNRLKAIGIFFGCLVILLPWWLRNRIELGRGIWMTTHGGYTLLLANNPIIYEHWKSSPSRQWDDQRFHDWWASKKANEFSDRPADEVALDAFANRLAYDTIGKSPWGFIKSCLIREGWLWAWWPSMHQSNWSTRLAIGLWYAVIGISAAAGMVRLLLSHPKQRELWRPALTLALSLCLVHAVYWSNMRMRAPLVPLISLLAVFSLRRSDAVEAGSSSDD